MESLFKTGNHRFSSQSPAERIRNILLIDDDSNMHIICRKVVESAGYGFFSAQTGKNGLEIIQTEHIDLVLLDFMIPGMDGYTILKALKRENKFSSYKNLPVIMLTVLTEDHPKRQQMLNMGLSLFINKPFGHKELLNIIDNVLVTNTIVTKKRESERKRLIAARKIAVENRKLREQIQQQSELDSIICLSQEMQEIKKRITKVATTDASILITGKSGTGKELVARAIHARSQRFSSPFVPVDCVALPPNLLESELFGHEKGAFTGAAQVKKGLLEVAHNGTFFLDEIGELQAELQAKLLRVLQERQFRRLGGKKLIEVDIRVIAATNRDPLASIKNGLLREDLYYRLNVIPIHLPPLRERRDDIPLLANHFLKNFNKRNKTPVTQIHNEVMDRLCRYNWPGNIRELQNIVERMMSLASDTTLTLTDLPGTIQPDTAIPKKETTAQPNLTLREARLQWMGKFEKKYLLDLISACNGNVSQVARIADVNRMTIYRLLKKYNIRIKIQAA